MNNKPRLLLYGKTWGEPRNIIFSHYLSEYFSVLVVTIDGIKNETIELMNPSEVRFERFKLRHWNGLAFTTRLKRIIKSFNPHFILTIETHSISSFQSMKFAANYKFTPVIFVWENTLKIPKYFFQREIQKKVIKRSELLIAGSADAKRYLIDKGANNDKIYINPETGFDQRIFFINGENFREEWGYKGNDFLILFAGRLVKEKGVELILKSAKQFEIKYDDIKFLFVGKGEMENEIRNCKMKNVFIKNSHNFVDMGRVIRSCDILVYPSVGTKFWVEQFGYSVVEGHACGKPVIVSNSGTLPRLVEDGVNGSIFQEGNQSSLEEKILWWYDRFKNKSNIDTSAVEKFSAKNVAFNFKKIMIDNDKTLQNNWY